MLDRAIIYLLRLRRALRLYYHARYSWHLAWVKSHGMETL